MKVSTSARTWRRETATGICAAAASQGRPQIERSAGVPPGRRPARARRGAARTDRRCSVGARPTANRPTSESSRLAMPSSRPGSHATPGRHCVALEARQIVLVDRVRDRLRLAGEPRVLAAHDALQRGQLDHHLRRQVALEERWPRAAAVARSASSRPSWPASAGTTARRGAPCRASSRASPGRSAWPAGA